MEEYMYCCYCGFTTDDTSEEHCGLCGGILRKQHTCTDGACDSCSSDTCGCTHEDDDNGY